jgi:hypothetical protein
MDQPYEDFINDLKWMTVVTIVVGIVIITGICLLDYQ